jgi:hypothetical protein
MVYSALVATGHRDRAARNAFAGVAMIELSILRSAAAAK